MLYIKSKNKNAIIGLLIVIVFITILSCGYFNRSNAAQASSGGGQVPDSWVDNYARNNGFKIEERIEGSYKSNPQNGEVETITKLYILIKNSKTTVSGVFRSREIIIEHQSFPDRTTQGTFAVRQETVREIVKSLSLKTMSSASLKTLEITAEASAKVFASEAIGASTTMESGYILNSNHSSGRYKVTLNMNSYYEYRVLRFSETRITTITEGCNGSTTSFTYSHNLEDTFIFYSAICDIYSGVNCVKLS